jgi:hypothetical protein
MGPSHLRIDARKIQHQKLQANCDTGGKQVYFTGFSIVEEASWQISWVGTKAAAFLGSSSGRKKILEGRDSKVAS